MSRFKLGDKDQPQNNFGIIKHIKFKKRMRTGCNYNKNTTTKGTQR